MKIRKGDTVIVTKGKSRGQKGEVIKISTEKVFVKGVNIGKIRLRATTPGGKSELKEVEKSVNVSNVSIFDEKKKKATRVGFEGKGKDKKRISKASGSVIKVSVKKSKK